MKARVKGCIVLFRLDIRLKDIYKSLIEGNIKKAIPKYAFTLVLDSRGLSAKLRLEDGNDSTRNTFVLKLDMSQNGF